MAAQHGPRLPRYLEHRIKASLDDTRVVMIAGPRQAGKTTLAKKIGGGERPYVTLDDEGVYQAATADPASFIRQFEFVTIDEIQRVPELIREIKMSVDQDQRPGRFLLTGSANILTIPTVTESLAGRMAVTELLPLSQCEIENGKCNSLDWLFESDETPFPIGPFNVADLDSRVLSGGYPEMLSRPTKARKRAWIEDYARTLLTRDIKEIMNVHKLREITALLQASAIQSAQLIVYSHMANDLRLSVSTVQRYIGTLEQMFLLRFLPAWHRNELKRLVRTPKLHFLDSGLLASIRRITQSRMDRDRSFFGPLLESFIYAELLKHAAWSDHPYEFYHYRDKDKVEVDFVIERGLDELIGVEVKASATIREDDFKGLKRLQSVTGDAFKQGIVLYSGDKALSFGGKLQAVPVSALWLSKA
ncbi:MAG: ATP-binding protein [Roseovarius sp.]|nr:ATP-binding protein [Roseovarius sp.]MCY4317074.1 ATP-binding protein [Roseovarius sp.]